MRSNLLLALLVLPAFAQLPARVHRRLIEEDAAYRHDWEAWKNGRISQEAFMSSSSRRLQSAPGKNCASVNSATLQTVTIKKIQSEIKAGESCGKSSLEGAYVKFDCTTNAVGGTSDSYNADYLWCQDTTETSAEHTGMELFQPKHSAKLGETITVQGVVLERYGVTLVDVCQLEITSGGAITLVTPTVVPLTDLDAKAGCAAKGEKWEGVLVKIENVKVAPCANDANPNHNYCKGNLDMHWTSTWDKYNQLWVSDTDGNTFVELDNNMAHAAEIYLARADDTGASGGPDTWAYVIGVVTYAYGSWDLLPRFKSDIAGIQISTDNFPTKSLSEIKQNTHKFKNDVGEMPASLLGTDESSPAGEKGDGGARFASGNNGYNKLVNKESAQYANDWTKGSCPPITVMSLIDQAREKTQNLCTCYPLNLWDPATTKSATYFNVRGRVQFITDPTGPFYFSESCDKGKGIYVYRNTNLELSAGMEIEMVVQAYSYYGLEQLSSPIAIKILDSSGAACPPVDFSNTGGYLKGGPSGTWCNPTAEEIEGTYIEIKCARVKTLGSENVKPTDMADWVYHDEDGAVSWESWWDHYSCQDDDGNYLDNCVTIMTDRHGHEFAMDTGNDRKLLGRYYEGQVPGHPDKKLAVGDVFFSLKGFIDSRRGSWCDKGTYAECNTGGYYVFLPKVIEGWGDPSGACNAEPDDVSRSMELPLAGAALGGLAALAM